MRGYKRQKQKVYISKVTEGLDGIDTITKYSKPELYKLSVSATSGTPEELSAGIVPSYDRYITSFNRDFKPDEGDILWIDVTPQLDDDGELVLDEDNVSIVKPDYRLTKILDTQRGLIARYGISKIGAEDE